MTRERHTCQRQAATRYLHGISSFLLLFYPLNIFIKHKTNTLFCLCYCRFYTPNTNITQEVINLFFNKFVWIHFLFNYSHYGVNKFFFIIVIVVYWFFLLTDLLVSSVVVAIIIIVTFFFIWLPRRFKGF